MSIRVNFLIWLTAKVSISVSCHIAIKNKGIKRNSTTRAIIDDTIFKSSYSAMID